MFVIYYTTTTTIVVNIHDMYLATVHVYTCMSSTVSSRSGTHSSQLAQTAQLFCFCFFSAASRCFFLFRFSFRFLFCFVFFPAPRWNNATKNPFVSSSPGSTRTRQSACALVNPWVNTPSSPGAGPTFERPLLDQDVRAGANLMGPNVCEEGLVCSLANA
jgi:hypothetical protein